MRSMSRRSRRRSIGRLVRPLLSMAALAVGLLLTGSFVGIAMRQGEVQGDVRAAQAGIDRELARRAELQAEIAERQTPAYVIEKARDLGYVRPGEGLIAVERGPLGGPVVRINATDGGRLGRWVQLFLGKR